MNKKILGIILLLFVAVSIVVLIAKEKAKENSVAPVTLAAQEQMAKLKPHHLKIYYFHGNVRCPSCRNIESYTQETVTAAFKPELDEGYIDFQVVNVDKPENEKFIEKYKLTTKQVIIADYEDGTEKRWKNLDRIWELLSVKDDFAAYEKLEIQEWLKGITR